MILVLMPMHAEVTDFALTSLMDTCVIVMLDTLEIPVNMVRSQNDNKTYTLAS